MFKKSLLALSLVAVSTTAAFAAPTANIIVNGAITPPTCAVNGEDETDLVYTFDTSPGLIPATVDLTLPYQTKSITVICDAPTYLVFNVADQRKDSNIGSHYTFGLGKHGSVDIGSYTIQLLNFKVKTDDNTAYQSVPVYSNSSQIPNTAYSSMVLNDTYTNKASGWGQPGTNSELMSAKVFTGDIRVSPTLSHLLKGITEDIAIDGLTIMTFKFGL